MIQGSFELFQEISIDQRNGHFFEAVSADIVQGTTVRGGKLIPDPAEEMDAENLATYEL